MRAQATRRVAVHLQLLLLVRLRTALSLPIELVVASLTAQQSAKQQSSRQAVCCLCRRFGTWSSQKRSGDGQCPWRWCCCYKLLISVSSVVCQCFLSLRDRQPDTGCTPPPPTLLHAARRITEMHISGCRHRRCSN